MPAHRRGPWTPDEDARLLALVHASGLANTSWVHISHQLNDARSPKQCRERYCQNLDPRLSHGPITEDEARTIEAYVNTKGTHWADIARILGGRSDNAVKNWWNGSKNRRRRNHLAANRHRPSSQTCDSMHSASSPSLHQLPSHSRSASSCYHHHQQRAAAPPPVNIALASAPSASASSISSSATSPAVPCSPYSPYSPVPFAPTPAPYAASPYPPFAPGTGTGPDDHHHHSKGAFAAGGHYGHILPPPRVPSYGYAYASPSLSVQHYSDGEHNATSDSEGDGGSMADSRSMVDSDDDSDVPMACTSAFRYPLPAQEEAPGRIAISSLLN